MLKFESVSKKFRNGKSAVSDIDLRIDNGEFIFLVGSSGAGKTTLLRLIFRDLLPTNGSLFLNDIHINKLPESKIPHLRRKLGFIFQDFKILYERTVYENVAIALEILGKKRQEINKKVSEVLETVGLEDKEDYFPIQMSLGELQRVAIARAIVGDTEILLADEPTGNLDPKISWGILKILNNIHKSGKTIIMATHNVDIVNTMKKRVITLDKGKIVKDEKGGKYT